MCKTSQRVKQQDWITTTRPHPIRLLEQETPLKCKVS